jgi:uncharacterized protein (TIGR03083 family)
MKLAPRYDGPPIISIAGAPDDQRAPLTRQRRRLEATLADLGADDWAAASRCDGWTVQDVIAHLVGVNGFWNASVRAGMAGTPTRVLTGFDPAATPPLMVGPMRSLAPAEILEQFVASNDAFLGAIGELDDAAWSMPAETPAGHIPIRLLAHHALWDSWVHERDVALPLGLTPVVEADEVLSALRYASALSPALGILCGGTFRGTYAVETRDPGCRIELEVDDSIAVRDGSAFPAAPCLRGGAVDMLETLSLRVPLPPSAPAEWRRLLAGLATAFDAAGDQSS